MFENHCHMLAEIAFFEVIVGIAACVAYLMLNMKSRSPHLSALRKRS